MAMAFLCSPKFLLLVFLISAIPIAYIIHVETSKPATHVYEFHSDGWMRECAKWDAPNNRFLVTFISGGVGEVVVPDDYVPGTILKEKPLLKDADLAGNASVGFIIDRPRNRILVAISDLLGNKYNAVAAYDITTWKRLFVTMLSGPEDEKQFADDVTVDAEGNSYITDAKQSKIWKVGTNGEFKGIINSPLFTFKEWYRNIVGVNGIAHHPDGYLLVIHTSTGTLYKVDIENGDEVKVVDVEGSIFFGDGLELLSPTKLIVAGFTTRLVESTDNWKSARVVGTFKSVTHRVPTSSTVKDGKVYVNHMFNLGYPKQKHVLVEAVF